MNSEELWETTLDPSAARADAGDAGRSRRGRAAVQVLMGEDVERRRQFIEEHALEVTNLDV